VETLSAKSMSYFNFNFVTDPPNDELVGPVTQLNDNWQDINDKTTGFNKLPNTLVNPPVGTEAFYPGDPASDNNRIAVFNGTDWFRNFNRATGVTDWLTVDLISPFVVRPGWPVVARINASQRYVELAGGVQISASATAWPITSDQEFTTLDAIDSSVAPVGGSAFKICATGQVVVASQFAQATVYAITVDDHVALRARYQGNSGGGNFIMLDGFKWWF
jgi:hypothetical protein